MARGQGCARLLGTAAVALGLALGTAAPAAAQTITNVPINTDALIVKPTDTASNIASGTTKFLGRAVAGTLDDNGFVRTINRLLGRSTTLNTRQPSGLPSPSLYPSTKYPNSFKPAMPTTMQFGTSPNIR